MIPKIIHYCWFGRGKMPLSAIKCIESWKMYLPDYELMCWNEDSFNVADHPFTQEAYETRKFAFVTDYVRLYALYHYGGVYMDTDVEVIKNLDVFLNLPAFSGFEDEVYIPTGIMASEKHGAWVRDMLDYYSGRHFRLSDGTLDITTNVQIISGLMIEEGFKLKNSFQVYKNQIYIYPKDYFCPKSQVTGKIYLTKNTYCIHHFGGSWHTPWQRFKKKMKPVLASLGLYVAVRKLLKI